MNFYNYYNDLDTVNSNLECNDLIITNNTSLSNVHHYSSAYRIGNIIIINILLNVSTQTIFNSGDIITTLQVKASATNMMVGYVDANGDVNSAWIRIANYNVIFASNATLQGGTYACQLVSPVYN